MDETRLETMAEDVDYLRRWSERHEKRHGNEADMLDIVLEHLNSHTSNHHGRASEIKRTASIATLLAVLAGIAEAIRQVFL